MDATAAIELDGQYRALREEAAFVVRPSRALLAIHGSEAAEYLQGQLTNDVEALAPGEGCYAALLDRKGHMQSDLWVLRRSDDDFRLELEREALERVHRHLETYKIGREVELDEIADRHAVVSVIGPAAAERLGFGPLRAEGANREERVGEVSCIAVATDLGIDLLLGAEALEPLTAALRDAGIEPASEAAAEILRVETGRPRFGREMTTATIPQEAGITERAVSFTKGCYIGQETVARLHYKGRPNRHLRGLRLGAPAADGDPVALGERPVGEIGTAVVSPAHGPIALAILRREAEPGSQVTVAGSIAAEVVEPPF